MTDSPITFCISTFNNLPYLKIAVESVRRNSFFKDAPFIVHAENCTDGTNHWLVHEGKEKYNLTIVLERNEVPVGIGGGMNKCAELVQTKYIMFLHSDFYVGIDWDKVLYDVYESSENKRLWLSSFRIEPDQFNQVDWSADYQAIEKEPGTLIVPTSVLGNSYSEFPSYHDVDNFLKYISDMYEGCVIQKGHGVSGLVTKELWDEIGGNDPLFAPASFDDLDLFLRMRIAKVNFEIHPKSIVWHFGARGSHRLEENQGKSSSRQKLAEEKNIQLWVKKWGGMPVFDSNNMICGAGSKNYLDL